MPKADGQSSFPPRAHRAVTHRAGTLATLEATRW